MSTNSYKIRCDLCDKKHDVQNIIQNGTYWHCISCYIWLTIKYDSESDSDTKGVMCSNCDKNPVAEKQLCGFTDWCVICDTTLWSMRDHDKPDETVFETE